MYIIQYLTRSMALKETAVTASSVFEARCAVAAKPGFDCFVSIKQG